MGSALIVTQAEKSIAFFDEILCAALIDEIVHVRSCGEARRLLVEREFDFVIINAPLKDERGESLSIDIAETGMTQVILIVNNEFYEAISQRTEEAGVLTIVKPLSKDMLWSALKLAMSAYNRFKKINRENIKLKQKIEDIRVIDRAKYILFSHYKMSESEAHRYIEKQAMDMRVTRRQIAENILKTYDN